MWLNDETTRNGDGGFFKAAAAANMVDLNKNRLQQTCRAENSLQVCRSRFFYNLAIFASSATIKRPFGRPVFTKQPYSITVGYKL